MAAFRDQLARRKSGRLSEIDRKLHSRFRSLHPPPEWPVKRSRDVVQAANPIRMLRDLEAVQRGVPLKRFQAELIQVKRRVHWADVGDVIRSPQSEVEIYQSGDQVGK